MEKEVATTNQNAVVPFNIASPPAEYLEDMKGVKVEYPQIKVPAGGMQFFEIDGEPVKELMAIILYKRPQRVYYALGIDETDGNAPPDCYSNDFEVGYERIADVGPDEQQFTCKKCSECPFSKWGSAGRGQACKEKTELYILLEGNFLPMRFVLPVTSKVMFDQYMTKLMNKGRRYCNVVTKIKLSKQTSSGNIDYARAEFECVRDLDESSYAKVLELQEQIKGVING